jgi:hypothetical protein
MNQELLDKIFEIKQLALDITGDRFQDEKDLDKIIEICEDISIDYKVNERLQRTDNHL